MFENWWVVQLLCSGTFLFTFHSSHILACTVSLYTNYGIGRISILSIISFLFFFVKFVSFNRCHLRPRSPFYVTGRVK